MRETTYTCNACGRELTEGLLVEVKGSAVPFVEYFQHYCNASHMLQKVHISDLEPPQTEGSTGKKAVESIHIKWTRFSDRGITAGGTKTYTAEAHPRFRTGEATVTVG